MSLDSLTEVSWSAHIPAKFILRSSQAGILITILCVTVFVLTVNFLTFFWYKFPDCNQGASSLLLIEVCLTYSAVHKIRTNNM